MFNDKDCDKIKYRISKKVVLQIVLVIVLERSELVDMILYLLKKILTFHSVIILIKSFINKNKNIYYDNTFLEKGLHKDRWLFVYYKCYIMIELTFLKKLILIKQMHQNSVIFLIVSLLVFLKL